MSSTEEVISSSAPDSRGAASPEPSRDGKVRGRGFASLSVERRREVSRLGGRRAHALGTAHRFTSEEAQAAGRKGGLISRRGSKKGLPVDTPHP